MEFFETFWTWLDGQLQLYISTNTERVATALMPAIVIVGTLYIMIWGYLHLTGKIDEPFTAGLKRILTLAVVLVLCLHFWLYNDLIVDTFYEAPAQLAGAVVGAVAPVQVIDRIWAQGASVAENLQSRWTAFSGWDFLIMAYIIRIMVGALCVYTMFLIALSKVALSVLLALGPFFVVMVLFEQTEHYFRSWLGQLSNYALLTILTVMVCALILGVVQTYADDTLGRGLGIRTVDALNLLLICALALLFMMQITQIAAGLSGGGGLATGNVPSRAWAGAAGTALGIGALGVVGGQRAVRYVRRAMSSRISSKARERFNSDRSSGYDGKKRLVPRNSIEAGHTADSP